MSRIDDLIRRQDAVDIVTFECGEWQGIANRINEQIQRLPSAQQEIVGCIEALKEQKTSQLITNGIGVRYCSNCRRIDDKYSVANFCWFCGAKYER